MATGVNQAIAAQFVSNKYNNNVKQPLVELRDRMNADKTIIDEMTQHNVSLVYTLYIYFGVLMIIMLAIITRNDLLIMIATLCMICFGVIMFFQTYDKYVMK